MPAFLSLEQVLHAHSSLISAYGGVDGLRDLGLLQSAIAMPMTAYGGELLHADLFEMAAAYLFHITQNHPFLDGNKRTGAACALIFLAINDISVQADEDGLVEITLRVATGQADKMVVADFFRSIAQPD
jgi:death-on-curing protein